MVSILNGHREKIEETTRFFFVSNDILDENKLNINHHLDDTLNFVKLLWFKTCKLPDCGHTKSDVDLLYSFNITAIFKMPTQIR